MRSCNELAPSDDLHAFTALDGHAVAGDADAVQLAVAKDKKGEAPYSVDANLLHTSSEGKVLEDPSQPAPEYVYQRTVSPEDAPNQATMVEIEFAKGDPIAIDGKNMSPAASG